VGDDPSHSHDVGTFYELEIFPLTNTTSTAEYLRFDQHYVALQRQHNLRCSSREYFRSTCIRHQADAQGKHSRESSDHAKLGSIVRNEVETSDGANQEDGSHKDANDGDCDRDGLLIESSYTVKAITGEFFLWDVSRPSMNSVIGALALAGQCRLRKRDR
jgi:hypothetical protein